MGDHPTRPDRTTWTVRRSLVRRPRARAEAWVFEVKRGGKAWATLVDERIPGRALFESARERHDALDEVILPLRGRYWVRVGGWARTLSVGEAALIPRGVDHDSGITTPSAGTRFLVALFPAGLGVLHGAEPGGVELPEGSVAWLSSALEVLHCEPGEVGVLPISVLPGFLRSAVGRPRLSPEAEHPDPEVSRWMRALEQPDPPSLEVLADEAGLSPSHVQRRFSAAVGCSPLQYATRWKLDAVAGRLAGGTTAPIIEVAAEYGFNDMKHFRTLFRRRYGVAPSAYRRNPPPEGVPLR